MNTHFYLDDEDWQRTLKAAPQQVTDAIVRVITGSSFQLQAEAIENAPVGATGLLRGSIQGQQTRVTSHTISGGIVTAHPYAPAVEYGTRPHRPPVEPLKMWVRRKLGITTESDINAAAWAIANKIAKRGTKPQNFIGDAVRSVAPKYQIALRNALIRVTKEINAGRGA